MKITLTTAGKIPARSADLVRAAVTGDRAYTDIDAATAVHAIAGALVPAGWAWSATVTENDGTHIWGGGELTAEPGIGTVPDAAFRERLRQAEEQRDTAIEGAAGLALERDAALDALEKIRHGLEDGEGQPLSDDEIIAIARKALGLGDGA